MKTLQLFWIAVFSLSFFAGQAQSEAPAGYTRGAVVLTDSSVVSGYIRDKIRSNASLTLLAENKKKNYDGNNLISATVGDEKFICIKGDFFKVICEGGLSFLQKASDASQKPVYNGTEAIFINGTPGDRDDYFIYNTQKKQLSLVTKKNLGKVTDEAFANHTAALVKAREVHEEIAQLKEAVELYNSSGAN